MNVEVAGYAGGQPALLGDTGTDILLFVSGNTLYVNFFGESGIESLDDVKETLADLATAFTAFVEDENLETIQPINAEAN